jgi:DNA processing protein
MHTIERRVKAALWSLMGIGTQSLDAIFKTLSMEELHSQTVPQWISRCELASTARRSLLEAKSLAAVADRLENQLRVLCYRATFVGDTDWPERLSDIPQCPPVLFVRGPKEISPRRRLAIVGTRHPETGVLEHVQNFARELAAHGVGVVSGAAEGVDQSAHAGAIAAKQDTWAFIGSAIEEAQESQKTFYDHILSHHGRIYSEFPPGVKPLRHLFPRRNRLISGASDAVLIFRAGLDSGALYTANYAVEQNRKLLAVPGDIWAEHSAGCNKLIRDHKAEACLSVEDAMNALGLRGTLVKAEVTESRVDFSTSALSVLKVLDRTPKTFDEIAALAQPMATGAVASALVELELGGGAIQRSGRRYERC